MKQVNFKLSKIILDKLQKLRLKYQLQMTKRLINNIKSYILIL